ncbi:allantoinase [Dendrothele bispora CBS 962.96]|uniref:allantoinase n=1 Tax=Dendrothele bispora (strain CBS 962.96) TaxID=1314807 RepID=A0A4S8MU98_DENBC|nr:allantoinase [Dendrothele bispora CBS 962.96]
MITVCTSQNVLLGFQLQPATIVINDLTGKIIHIHRQHLPRDQFPSHARYIDAGSNHILPGLVDAHVHLNEPGRTDWEGFLTGTKAAVSGGVTTVVDMPLNSIPPTTTLSHLDVKRSAAQGQCFCDVAFWGGVIPGNQVHLRSLVDAGVKGFKCFLIESGVEEFPCVTENDLHASMSVLEDIPSVLLFHAELEDFEKSQDQSTQTSDPTLYATFLESRPEKLEADAISLITKLQATYPSLRCHIVHLSAASALPIIRAARVRGLKLTVETCFHYLCLQADDIPNGHPEFKCCPPIRKANNRELVWNALRDGTIECVVSDHSPCVQELKKLDDGDIMSAWGGISTLGLGLSLLWTEGLQRGVTIGDISNWTSWKTAEHAGLSDRKGKLEVGYDGDFLIWDPNAEFEVTAESLNFKNKVSPYVNRKLRGKVLKTFVRGFLVFDCVQGFEGIEPVGKLL